MTWQYIIIGIIIAIATGITVVRFIRFFTIPESKCEGCAMKGKGCDLKTFKLRSVESGVRN